MWFLCVIMSFSLVSNKQDIYLFSSEEEAVADKVIDRREKRKEKLRFFFFFFTCKHDSNMLMTQQTNHISNKYFAALFFFFFCFCFEFELLRLWWPARKHIIKTPYPTIIFLYIVIYWRVREVSALDHPYLCYVLLFHLFSSIAIYKASSPTTCYCAASSLTFSLPQ